MAIFALQGRITRAGTLWWTPVQPDRPDLCHLSATLCQFLPQSDSYGSHDIGQLVGGSPAAGAKCLSRQSFGLSA
jgi:hypothetical protein